LRFSAIFNCRWNAFFESAELGADALLHVLSNDVVGWHLGTPHWRGATFSHAADNAFDDGHKFRGKAVKRTKLLRKTAHQFLKRVKNIGKLGYLAFYHN
jgi:hypothetical protein